MANFDKWLEKNKEKLFRFEVYRRGYTPIEQDKKYMDQSQYEDMISGKILEGIELPDGDILLEVREYYDYEVSMTSVYIKLSEVKISMYDGDQEEYVD